MKVDHEAGLLICCVLDIDDVVMFQAQRVANLRREY
jgi:hypothetical protein